MNSMIDMAWRTYEDADAALAWAKECGAHETRITQLTNRREQARKMLKQVLAKGTFTPNR